MVCTFFGHKDTPNEIESILKSTIKSLIENNTDCKFFVGNNGNFDTLVQKCLGELADVYPIKYDIVLSYMPKKNPYYQKKINNTILPEGIEKVPKCFAISYRNNWMIKNADFVITYVKYPFSNSAKYKEIAIKKKKEVIELFNS